MPSTVTVGLHNIMDNVELVYTGTSGFFSGLKSWPNSRSKVAFILPCEVPVGLHNGNVELVDADTSVFCFFLVAL